MPPGVHLAGEGEVLLCSTDIAPLIAVFKAEQCTITGLKMQQLVAGNVGYAFEYSGSNGKTSFVVPRPCIVFAEQASEFEIADCTLGGLDNNGLLHTGILIRQSSSIAVQRCNISRLHNGIQLWSTAGASLEGNHCIGNETSGIAAARDPNAPDAPTDLTARNNLCEGNKEVGIDLRSAQATLEGNRCIGNEMFGIHASRNTDTPDAPTDLTARNNLCEENKEDGIVLHSARATLEGNSCIGNEQSGIAAHRADNTPDAPTVLTAQNNLCEGNKQPGIVLLSARATLEGNRCIGNGNSGIAAQRDSVAPDAPTDLTARNNLCEGNKEAGILLLSARATLEGNSCIGNEIGIAAERDPDAPDAPTDLTARNNLCEGNGQSSIGLKHCLGSLSGNAFQCGTAGMVPVSISSPVRGLYPGYWRALSNGKGKTCLNLLPEIADESETHNEDALASLIRTGGCPHCFHRYWLGDIRQGHEREDVPRVPDVARPSPALDTETTEGIRFYEATPTQDNGAKIVRCSTHPFKGEGTLGNRLANTVNQLAKGDVACLWAVAHASPSDVVITETIEALKKYPIVRVIDLDLAPNGTELSLADRLANQLIERHTLRGARLRALACIPATGPFRMLMITLLLAVLVPVAFAGFDAGGYPALPRTLFDVLSYWQKGGGLAGKWVMAQSLFAWLPLLLVPSLAVRWFNRHIPAPLHLKDWMAPMLGKLRQVSDVFGQSTPTPSTQSLRDEDLQICGWLKFSLFGHRWFGMVGRPSDLVLVLRNVETLALERQAELRLWSSLRNKQVFVSITHVPGLAVLTDTWLDVWFGDSATSSATHSVANFAFPRTKEDRAFLLHDIAHTHLIQTKAKACANPTDGLSAILGFGEDPSDACNELSDDRWGLYDMLPALIIGSNHLAPMTVKLVKLKDSEKILNDARTEFQPYGALLPHPFPSSADSIVKFRQHAKVATGILDVVSLDEQHLLLTGRQAFRFELAQHLLGFYENRGKPVAPYLGDLLSLGEIHHLHQAIETLTDWNSGVPTETLLQRLPLRFEAALALRNERRCLPEGSPEESNDATRPGWDDLLEHLHDDLKTAPTSVRAVRIVIVCLQAEATLGATAHSDCLVRWAENPFIAPPGNNIWAAFLRELSDTMKRLSGYAPETAKVLLDKRMRQDWAGMPEATQHVLRSALEKMDGLIFGAMCRTADRPDMERLCRALTGRPAFLVANLLVLALRWVRKNGDDPSGVITKLRAIINDPQEEMGARFIGIPSADCSDATCRAAWETLQAMQAWEWSGTPSSCPNLQDEIEGFALGAHSSVASQLEHAKVVDITLQAA